MTWLPVLSLFLALQAQPAVSSAQLAEAYFLYLEGRALSEDGNLTEAIAKLRASLDVAPSAEVVAELAGIYAQQGELARAETEAERALSLDHKNQSAHRLLGLILASKAEPLRGGESRAMRLRAIQHLEVTTSAPSRDPAVQLTLGELYLRVGELDKSIFTLQKFLIDRPGFPQATMLLAEAYRAANQLEAAAKLVAGLNEASEGSPAGLTRSAAGFEARRDWARAADAWSKVIEADPRDSQARLRYATALVNSGNLERGRAELAALTRDDPSDALAWDLLSQAELAAGRFDAAEAAARTLAALDATSPRGTLALAEVRHARGDHRGAIAAVADRLAAPSEADVAGGAYREMAELSSDAYLALGNRKEATATLERARKRLGDDVALLFSLAATYEQAGDIGKAEKTFREVIAADAEHAPALNYLGYMLADRGRKLPEAVTLIERALAIDPENPSYLDSLGWAYFKQGRTAESITPLERAAAGAPRASVIQDHLGDAYVKARRHADAVAAFERALAGDRDGIDENAIAKKRDRARAEAGKP